MNLQQTRKSYDPNELTRTLAHMFAKNPPTGFIVGYTSVRNAVAEIVGCSPRDAEEIVDTLILRGRLLFLRPRHEIGSWAFRVPASN